MTEEVKTKLKEIIDYFGGVSLGSNRASTSQRS